MTMTMIVSKARRIVAVATIALIAWTAVVSTAQAQSAHRGKGSEVEERQAAQLVHEWLAAWVDKDADKMASYMAADVRFSGNYPAQAPETGRARFLQENAPFIKMGIKIRIVQTTSIGGPAGTAVLIRRVDTFSFNGRTMVVPVAAFYFVKDGQIETWLDIPLINLGPLPAAPPPPATGR